MGDILVPAAILLVLIGALVVAGYVIRRWAQPGSEMSQPLWTLHELTRLRDSGELTIEQYEKLKAKAIQEEVSGRRQA